MTIWDEYVDLSKVSFWRRLSTSLSRAKVNLASTDYVISKARNRIFPG